MAQLQYTKASLILAGSPDPYNPDAAKQQWAAENSAAARDQRLSSDGAVGFAYQVTKTVVNTVVNEIVGGPIAQALWGLADLIGDAVTDMSSGGFDTLPVLARQRLALEMPGWGNKKATIYKSQSFVGAVQAFGVLVKPDIVKSSESEFQRTLRNYLIAEAQAQEFNRITKTGDEPILPAVAIRALNQAGLYPPPIQPMELTRQGWQADYPGYDAWYTYNPPSFGPTGLNFASGPPAGIPAARQAVLAQAVSAQLQADYAQDAKLFSAQLQVLALVMPADLQQLLQQTQMAPRSGSPANPSTPVLAPSGREGRL